MIEAGDIIGIKLLGDAEIICKLEEETDTHYKTSDAMFWDLVQVGEKYDFRFSPPSVGQKTANDATHFGLDISFPKQSVLFTYEPRVELVERYRKMTSPIVLLR
jgi:hypothetical protein